jgi:hypothetical protein
MVTTAAPDRPGSQEALTGLRQPTVSFQQEEEMQCNLRRLPLRRVFS